MRFKAGDGTLLYMQAFKNAGIDCQLDSIAHMNDVHAHLCSKSGSHVNPHAKLSADFCHRVGGAKVTLPPAVSSDI